MNAPSSTATIAETETYSKSAGLGRTGALPLAGLLKQVSENIVQTDNEVIVKVASEFCDKAVLFFFGHVLHIFWGEIGVDVVQDILAILQKIDFNGFFPWADDPVLRDAAGRIDVFLCRLSFLAVLGCSGGHRHHPAPDQLLLPFFLICQITAQCKGLLLPLLYAKFSGKLTCTHSFPL